MEPFVSKAKAISDFTRVRMLKLLEGGELCVCEIMEVIDIGQSAASKHLGILKTSGLVKCRKEGTWSYYRLVDDVRGINNDFMKFMKTHLNDNEIVKNDKRFLNKMKRAIC
jgi:DNA-binding transcriptional ArsR family regulator